MGIIYNAGNERKYYKQYKAETSDNLLAFFNKLTVNSSVFKRFSISIKILILSR